jgi:hypothetical protein
MRLRSFATLAILVAALVPAAAAHAAVSNPIGPGCRFVGDDDPTAEPGTVTGTLGGALVLTDDTTHLPGSGSLTCRIQVNVSTHTGSGPQVQGHGTGVVGAGPSEVSFVASATDTVYLCMEFTDDSDGTTYYWDPVHKVWTTDPNGPCGLAGIVFGILRCIAPPYYCGITRLVDWALCSQLAQLAPGVPPVYIAPDGDVWINGVKWFDCPPYFP